MEQKVEISRATLLTLVGALALSLLLLAFVLGRMTAQPVAVASPSPVKVAPVALAPPLVESPTPALLIAATPTPRPRATPGRRPAQPEPVRVAVAPPPEVVTPPPAAEPPAARPPAHRPNRQRPKPVGSKPDAPAVAARPAAPEPPAAKPADVEGMRRYFQQLDAAMAGSAAISDPNAFATQLLQQSLQGDTSGFDALLDSAQEALRTVQAIKAPPSCAEHHKLTVGQLREGVDLLSKVRNATASMDTTSLSNLSLEGKGLQADAMRLQELDRTLRAQIR